MDVDEVNIVGGDIPVEEVSKSATECAIESKQICAPKSHIINMINFLQKRGVVLPTRDEQSIIAALKQLLNVKTEAEIWNDADVRLYIGDPKAEFILRTQFKPEGPTDSTALLDNFNIDETLNLWSNHGQILFGKKFYHVPFQMIDFMLTGTELSKLDVNNLIRDGYSCWATVLNTDISSGRGKHWFCLYGDLMHTGDRDDPYVLEYFNSSGNLPMDEVNIWMEQTVHNLLRDNGKHMTIHRSATRRLQFGDNECGIWCLMYIKSRLLNHPPNWFYTVQANDADMFKLRKHLFRKKLSKKL